MSPDVCNTLIIENIVFIFSLSNVKRVVEDQVSRSQDFGIYGQDISLIGNRTRFQSVTEECRYWSTPIQVCGGGGVEVGWQERAPRSLSKDYVEPGAAAGAVEAGSTATPKPPLARPHDVFISVKTTGHYHRARLPVILKTWFQLAKDQDNHLTSQESIWNPHVSRTVNYTSLAQDKLAVLSEPEFELGISQDLLIKADVFSRCGGNQFRSEPRRLIVKFGRLRAGDCKGGIITWDLPTQSARLSGPICASPRAVTSGRAPGSDRDL
ncbi:hypothetical protein J6590_077437 [Homalodisca vitripennis]|nr:hypothetical protein J6590_077437 [Homalodisca vitripennis]